MHVGVTAIERKRDLVSIKFRENAIVDAEKLARFVAAQRGSQFTPDGMLKFSLPGNDAGALLGRLRELLEDLAGLGIAKGPEAEAV